MIKVICIGHNYEYEIRELLKLFYKQSEIEISCVSFGEYVEEDFNRQIISKETLLTSMLVVKENKAIATSKLNGEEKIIEEQLDNKTELEIKKTIKRLIKKSLFKLLQKSKNIEVPWGILTGIRPTKIVHELLENGFSEENIMYTLINEYCIDTSKAKLLLDVAKTEYRYVYPIDESKISLYISIPFCPTRCLYCSFPSNPLNQSAHLVDSYVDALCREIEGVAKLIKEVGKKVQTIYVGGGTPTTLSVTQFTRIFDTIKASIDLDYLEEFTVEAGRPDTIDYDKLMYLKGADITRLSINPQTMNNCTLKEIGREHTVDELVKSYKMALEIGFENINMDIIIGLPGEDTKMVEHTMNEIKKLSPINLTVHTLAIKRASRLKDQEEEYSLAEQQEVMDMLEITQNYAEVMGLKPYYMYRQKHMVGNLENIGYSNPGYECIYNIQIMEEKQTILALGAGAVSKITFPSENRLERVPNIKNLEQYIERVDEMIERKRKFFIDNI
ncbi:coproporphyrinogen dehydrogenase HemZ [Alkaliphilus sp. B6464]|uniref:coproporphyrinogen dehydrogenase HemZ n=1 Tax=Alkaliphilus sp. B6464 TaxID=2731219 RepID=UPI001BA7D55A|nr:coproporphyrinogen dehydrogenase HemZ [Alkaliphilus sp. B6464]QUH21653.1 coproporphyrinogen dehydrogenase HemZ [Alkaliphilus sp. B6464]